MRRAASGAGRDVAFGSGRAPARRRRPPSVRRGPAGPGRAVTDARSRSEQPRRPLPTASALRGPRRSSDLVPPRLNIAGGSDFGPARGRGLACPSARFVRARGRPPGASRGLPLAHRGAAIRLRRPSSTLASSTTGARVAGQRRSDDGARRCCAPSTPRGGRPKPPPSVRVETRGQTETSLETCVSLCRASARFARERSRTR